MMEKFRKYLEVELNLSENTTHSYCLQLKGFITFLEGLGRNEITAMPEDIRAYLSLKSDLGNKASSRFITIMAIKKYYGFTKSRGFRNDDPSILVSIPKVHSTSPDPLSTEEIECLIKKSSGSRFSLIRMKAMLEILYSTGIRISELVGIRIPDVDLDSKWIRIIGKGEKFRDVPFGPKVEEALKDYIGAARNRWISPPGNFLFLNAKGGQLTRGGFWKQLKILAGSLSITGSVFPHRIRHTTAYHLLSEGLDIRFVQELLGHSSITTTQRYTKVKPELLKTKIESAHPHF
jgi:integrase/recombinase XerD